MAEVEVNISYPVASKTVSGVMPFWFEVKRARDAAPRPYRLLLTCPRSALLPFEKKVAFDGESTSGMVYINTHLLPEGDVPMHVRLSDERGHQLWTHAFELNVSNAGPVAKKVRDGLRAQSTPLVLDGPIDSTAYGMANPALTAWFDRPDALAHIEELIRQEKATPEEAAALRQFVADGYAILPQPIEDKLLDAVNRDIDDAIAKKFGGYQYGTSQRIQHLHKQYRSIEKLWRHPMVMRFLELVFEVPARPCQTLTYVFGSQQGAHQDTIHLTPFPQGYMCGVWIALEDVKPASGELEVFRGSHRLPRVYMEGSGCRKVTNDDWKEWDHTVAELWRSMLAANRFEKVVYRPKRGTVLVWHENLMHGGAMRVDQSLSRRSIVSHYFAEGAVAFYDSTGVPGNME